MLETLKKAILPKSITVKGCSGIARKFKKNKEVLKKFVTSYEFKNENVKKMFKKLADSCDEDDDLIFHRIEKCLNELKKSSNKDIEISEVFTEPFAKMCKLWDKNKPKLGKNEKILENCTSYLKKFRRLVFPDDRVAKDIDAFRSNLEKNFTNLKKLVEEFEKDNELGKYKNNHAMKMIFGRDDYTDVFGNIERVCKTTKEESGDGPIRDLASNLHMVANDWDLRTLSTSKYPPLKRISIKLGSLFIATFGMAMHNQENVGMGSALTPKYARDWYEKNKDKVD